AEHLAAGVARGYLLARGERGQRVLPALGQLAAEPRLELGRQLGVGRGVALDEVLPRGLPRGAFVEGDALEVVVDLVRHVERLVLGPAEGALGGAQLVVAERLAVG